MAKSEISEWMPIEINRFYASKRVRNMRDFQKWWYMALLLEAWQSDPPCHLSADSEELRMIAGANQSDWDKHSKLVLGCFSAVEGTNLVVNEVQLEIFNRQMSKHAANKANGKKGADARWRKDSPAIAPPSFANGNREVDIKTNLKPPNPPRRGARRKGPFQPGLKQPATECGWCGKPLPCESQECEAKDAEIRMRHAAHA